MKKFIAYIIIINALIIFGLSSLMSVAKANSYNTATTAHIITETIKGTDIDISYIMEKELEAVAHKFMIESISILQAYLPAILDGVASDMRLKADHEYKCKLLENGGMNDGCN